MGYSKEAAYTVTDFKSNYISAGIQENISLDNVEVKTSPTGNKLFQITFKNDEGQTLPHTEWEPKTGPFTKSEKDLDRAKNRQYKRMLQILLCFYKDEQITFEGERFDDFATYIATMLNAADKSIKLRVKVVYNKNGYTTLPSRVDDIFIEPMSVSKEDSKIEIKPEDLITRPILPDKEIKNENPFDSDVTTTTVSESDLPF